MPNYSCITHIAATSYRGDFAYSDGSGHFGADANLNLTSISGTKEGIGSFEAYLDDGGWNYNPHFTDLTKVMDLVNFMTGAIAGVTADLALGV